MGILDTSLWISGTVSRIHSRWCNFFFKKTILIMFLVSRPSDMCFFKLVVAKNHNVKIDFECAIKARYYLKKIQDFLIENDMGIRCQ